MRIEYPKLSAQIVKATASFQVTSQTAFGIYSPAFLKDASNLATTGHKVLVNCGEWIGRGRTVAEINPSLRFNALEDHPGNHRAKFIASELIYGEPHKRMQEIADGTLRTGVKYQRGWAGLKLLGPSNLVVVIASPEKKAKAKKQTTIQHPMKQAYESESATFTITPKPEHTSQITIGENITVSDIEEIFVHTRGGYTVSLFQEDHTDDALDLRLEISEGEKKEIKINLVTPQFSNVTDVYSPILRYAVNNGTTVIVSSKDAITGKEYKELSASYNKRYSHSLSVFLDDFHDPTYLGAFTELVKEFMSNGTTVTVKFGNRPPEHADELKRYLDTEMKRQIQVHKQKGNDEKPAYTLKP